MRLRRTRSTAATAPRPAAAIAAALVLAGVLGCSAPASEVRDEAILDGSATSASGGSTPGGDSTAGPSLDPAYAVDPPGRFKALPRTADVVVQTQETIDEETLEIALSELREASGGEVMVISGVSGAGVEPLLFRLL